MRFRFENVPEGQTDALEAKGWQEAPALDPRMVQSYGLIAAFGGMLLVGILLRGTFRPTTTWAAVLILVTTVPLHELVHALSTPAWGLSERTVIGVQRGTGLLLPYMYYDGEQPLRRMLLTGLAPVLVLTLIPLVFLSIMPVSGPMRANLGFLAFLNIAVSGGDLVTFLWISTHLPAKVTVRRNGWGLLWKYSE